MTLGRTETLLWALALAAACADILTTVYGLSNGLSESNPLIASTNGRGTLALMIALKAFAVTIGLLSKRVSGLERTAFIPALIAGPWILAAGYNSVLIYNA